MVKIEFLELTADFLRYRYFPEDSKDCGEVSLNRKTGERNVEKTAERYPLTYAAHALHRMEEYLKNGKFPKTDIVAWY